MTDKIDIGDGWWPILDAAIDEVSTYPQEWLFEITGAGRHDGALLLSAKYHSPDVPLEKDVAHPFRAFVDLRERMRLQSMGMCEICGGSGRLRGDGDAARVRCDADV